MSQLPIPTPDEINAKFQLVSDQYNLLLKTLSTVQYPNEILQIGVQDFFKAFCIIKEAFNIMLFQAKNGGVVPDEGQEPLVVAVVGNDAA